LNQTSQSNLTAELYTLFGETVSSFDRVLEAKLNIDQVNVIDKCNFNSKDVIFVKYSKQKKAFIIKIKNNNPVDCYVDLELKDVFVGFIQKTLSIEGSVLIESGKTQVILISEDLNNNDLDKNSLIDLIIYSGQKQDSLTSIFRGKFSIQIETITLLTYLIIIIAIIIVILIIIIFLILKKRRKYSDDY
jgi:hypothetical protein